MGRLGRNKYNQVFLLIFMLLIAFAFAPKIRAFENNSVQVIEKKNEAELVKEISAEDITYETTIAGQDSDYNIEILDINTSENDENINQEIEILFEFPTEENIESDNRDLLSLIDDIIKTPTVYADTKSGSKTSGGIKASLNVNYDRNTKGAVRINNVNGSWAPTSGLYYVTNRRVNYGINYASKTGYSTPTSNSFNISPNWGYVQSSVGTNGAVSSATGNVYGMSGTHNIEVEVKF